AFGGAAVPAHQAQKPWPVKHFSAFSVCPFGCGWLITCRPISLNADLAGGVSPLSQPSKTPLLDLIKTPADLRRLESRQLRQLADELRQQTLDPLPVTPPHPPPRL